MEAGEFRDHQRSGVTLQMRGLGPERQGWQDRRQRQGDLAPEPLKSGTVMAAGGTQGLSFVSGDTLSVLQSCLTDAHIGSWRWE